MRPTAITVADRRRAGGAADGNQAGSSDAIDRPASMHEGPLKPMLSSVAVEGASSLDKSNGYGEASHYNEGERNSEDPAAKRDGENHRRG